MEHNVSLISEQTFDQIAYAIRPMVTAAAEAYHLTSDEKYADIAGHFAAWFFGANDGQSNMYSVAQGFVLMALGLQFVLM